ncbi:hypothetical protein [Singulisphaera acidiphila]|uniref:Uncharacterized protein n=1 Tax=Singulisphaera acidiphila (strain ATCC BAA-1392 / DSM 18658 / VKM B-2454 / MOB10) TaxID=886293 RepID=L0DIW9_SINAD|nr:hypothetical protein [Singulisphaera acidiphila]AGA28763.1 hypothetical protein Sinac_4585 [Singulisphaera acidiphila DSM 18658]
MGLAQVIIDNPIVVKHCRARLRAGQALPWAAIVLVLTACIVWVGEYFRWVGHESVVMVLLGLQALILWFGGSNQLNTSLGGIRETGLIDFHRVSPLPPSVVSLGFFLGAPIREYLLAAITFPFALYSAYQVDGADPWRGLSWFLQLEVAVLTTTWMLHAFTMFGCMTRRKPRGSILGTVAAIVGILFFGYLGSVGSYLGMRWLLVESRSMNFFGFMIPWLLWVLIVQLPILGFVGLAVSRKMAAERAHALTKPQALACMATLTALLTGGLWNIARILPPSPPFEPTMCDVVMFASVYVLSLMAMVLSIAITPDAGEYVKGLRRAAHQGQRRISPWSDAGSNRLALFALCALVMVGATTVVHVVGRQQIPDVANAYWVNNPSYIGNKVMTDEAWLASRQALLSRPIAIGVLTVAYFGLGLQCFSLRTRSSGLVLMTLFLFIAWLVPLLVGAMLGIARSNQTRNVAIFALSPLPGIALSSGMGKFPGADTVQLAALAPSITFAFLFNYLLVITQRKIDRRLLATEKSSTKSSAGALKSNEASSDLA